MCNSGGPCSKIYRFLEEMFEEKNFVKETKDWAAQLAQGTYKEKDQLDEVIKKYAIDWEIDRIHLIDKNLLRLGIYEMVHLKTEKNIVIDEIINIAKKYSSDEAPKFINGVLDQVSKKECLQDS